MRTLGKKWNVVVGIISVALVLFQMYTAGFGVFSDLIQRTIHMAFVLSFCFLMKPMTKNAPKDRVPVYDIILALLAAAACLYVLLNNKVLLWRPLVWLSVFDKIFAVVLVVLVMEASRRTVGWIFPIMGAILFVYALLGPKFPGMWGHKGFSVDYILQSLYHTTNGMWGQMIGLAATMLAMFGIFGAMLSITGGAKTFIKLGLKCTGNSIGGPGKVATVASCLFGMVSGSAMGNVVATGTFTIPMMKKAGFSPEWAGAIEATVSTGGQIMPPIMASTAFIMAQILGLNYLVVAKAAIVPALLYFGSIFICIHYYAKKKSIKSVKVDEEKTTFTELAVIIVPLVSFLAFIAMGFSVTYAAFYSTIGGIITCVVVYAVERKNIKATIADTGDLLVNCAKGGAGNIVEMSTLLAGSQMSITLISMTGLGIKLSDMIVSIGQEHLFLCLVLSMLVCIILGMGLPTPAVYVIAAAILVPPLTQMGIDPFVAHMFMIYFSSLASITPPVCSAVYMASGIANSNWLKTGLVSVGIAIPGFVVPFIFCYNDALLLRGGMGENVFAVITALIGVYFISVAIAGFMKKDLGYISRAIFIVGGILLLFPDQLMSAIGAVICLVCMLLNRRKAVSAAN